MRVKCKNCKLFEQGVCQVTKKHHSNGKKRECSHYQFNGKERHPLPSFKMPWHTSAERRKLLKQARMVKNIDTKVEQRKLSTTAINTLAQPIEQKPVIVGNWLTRLWLKICSFWR